VPNLLDEFSSLDRPGFNRGNRIVKELFPCPSKYTPELKARAIELVLHAQADPDTARGAVSRIADELNLSRETLRIWVRKHREFGVATPTESVDLEAENRRLRRELAESQRANESLKKASAFFAADA
jgi:transposase-like protein